MGDSVDYWREHREYVREKKLKMANAIPAAMTRLDKEGVSYRQLDSQGEHFRVEEKYDWWPSTGYWREVNGNKRGHRVGTLIKLLKSDGLLGGGL